MMLMTGAFVSLFIVCLTLSIGHMEMSRRLRRLEKFIDSVIQICEESINKSTTERE